MGHQLRSAKFKNLFQELVVNARKQQHSYFSLCENIPIPEPRQPAKDIFGDDYNFEDYISSRRETVLVLTKENFDSVISENKYIFVEFCKF